MKVSMFLNRLFYVLSVFVLSTVITQAQILQYTFTGDTNAPAVEDSNLSGGLFGLSSTGSLTDNGFNAGNGGNTSGPPSRAAIGWTTSSSINLDQYWTFTVQADSGFQLNFSSLNFDINRNGDGPTAWAVRYSIDGFASDLATGSNTSSGGVGTSMPTQNVSLSDSGLTGNIEFRIYGYDSGFATNNAFRIDDITLNGSVTAVPEPTTISGLLLGGAVLALTFRKRRAQD